MIYLKSSIGIEIRQEDLLISCLQSNFRAGVFTHYVRISGFRRRDRAEVKREIDRFFKEARLDRTNLVLGVPRSDIIIRHLDLPIEVADNLKQVILYQVQTFEPTEEEKFYHDYVPMKTSEESRRIAVLLVMIKKSVLDGYLEVLRELDLKPSAVSTNSVALSNVFLQSRKDAKKTFLLVHLTAGGIEVITLREGMLAYSREVSADAGPLQKDLILREVEEAAGKVRMGPDDSIEKFVLAGDGVEAAQQALSQDIPECELIGTDLRFETPAENKPLLSESAASLGLAYSGLARRPPMKLNLLPQELRVQQNRWAYVPTIILGLVIIALLGALGLRQMFQERILARQLDQQIQSLRAKVSEVQGVRFQEEELEKRIQSMEGWLRKCDMNLEILHELTNILPQDTFLSVYSNREGTIQLSGSSPSASDLIPKLEQSQLIKDVVQRGTIFKDAQTGKDRFVFEAKVEGGCR